MHNGIANSIEQPSAEDQNAHRYIDTRDIHGQQAGNKRPDRSNEISHSSTPLERQPIFNELVNAKGKKIGQNSDDNRGEIPEYQGNDGVPVH